jgi:hypothetical protein
MFSSEELQLIWLAYVAGAVGIFLASRRLLAWLFFPPLISFLSWLVFILLVFPEPMADAGGHYAPAVMIFLFEWILRGEAFAQLPWRQVWMSVGLALALAGMHWIWMIWRRPTATAQPAVGAEPA